MAFVNEVDRLLTDSLAGAIPVAAVERDGSPSYGHAAFATNPFEGETKRVRDAILTMVTGRGWEPSCVTDKAFDRTLEMHYVIIRKTERCVLMVRWTVGEALKLAIAPGVS